MRVECKYDPKRDIQQVEPFGSVDLASMNASSSVPAVVPLSEEKYNGIDDPNSIAGRPSDQFDAMQANKAIVGYKPPKKDEGSQE